MNVLLTSVGRRAYMVKYFKEVLGDNGQVHVCNSDDKTVAFKYADNAVLSPLIYDDGYIDFLLDYCKNNKIDVLISLFDIDLLVLSKNKQEFEKIGTKVIVSDEKVIEICNDKWKTYLFLKEHGFNVPKTYKSLQNAILALDSGQLKYPIIIKPRFGCGSIGMSIAEDEMALLYYYRRNSRVISRSYLKYESSSVDLDEQILYQECLDGQEYGVDIINDLNGNFQNSIIKKKIAMRAGETDIAHIAKNDIIFDETKKLAQKMKHIANMDCDVFLVDGKPYILEMNARFGGGYPFSHLAGCNLPLAIVNWAENMPVEKEILETKKDIMAYKELFIVQA
ncbi:MAG: ATP-grasp domain-containing protein [Ruminococcaceae bacterium]|nr:ATP-grasp domain-containing protein [Oscillospiraceae bacterium]